MILRDARNPSPARHGTTHRSPVPSLQAAVDATLWCLATPLAYMLRGEGGAILAWPSTVAFATLALFSTKMVTFYLLRIPFRSWRRTSFQDLVVLAAGVGAAAAAGTILLLAIGPGLGIPRSIAALDGLVALAAMAGVRTVARHRYESRSRHQARVAGGHVGPRRVLIVGAGDAGTMVAREMLRHPELGLEPIGFVDDDASKAGLSISGVPVLGVTDDVCMHSAAHRIDEVLIAIPSADGAVVRRLKQRMSDLPDLTYRVLPGIYELLGEQVKLERFREVEIEDLLRRPPVVLDTPAISSYIEGRVVMVTGAGGSIGSELVRQICRFRPKELVLFGRGENSIYQLERELDREWPHVAYRSVIGALQNGKRLEQVFAAYRPDVVFHAAAHKHVPLMERNPQEAVFNNVIGSRNLIGLALRFGVSHFVNISTDKAVNPTSVMGATKRVVEHCVRQAADAAAAGQVFVSVRFGNVLGSRGSVVPLFREQIRKGGPVTVTHPDMTRYFMTIPEATQLVLQASAAGRNGDVYVLDMGEPVRITDLARDMIQLSGLEPDVDVAIVYSGLRPGEKLYEELLTDAETQGAVLRESIFVTRPHEVDPGELDALIARLVDAAMQADGDAIRRELNAFVPGAQLQVGDDVSRRSLPASPVEPAEATPQLLWPSPALG
jgi:FlaA1/EpsC-like NDP-sugar epimerase